MKGHMEKDGFHPHTQYKGVRKLRHQQAKSEGVKIRKRMSGYDRWITSAPPDPEEEALDIVVSDNLNLTAEQIARIKPDWWDDDDTDTIGDLFTIGTIKKKLNQEREMNQYFDEEARKHGRTQGVRMKRLNVCEPFLEDPASHRPDDTKHTNQIMYSLGDESCASVLTDEEFSMLLTDDQVANTFNPIGETATKWQQDDAFRKRIIGRAQELIEEQKKVNN